MRSRPSAGRRMVERGGCGAAGGRPETVGAQFMCFGGRPPLRVTDLQGGMLRALSAQVLLSRAEALTPRPSPRPFDRDDPAGGAHPQAPDAAVLSTPQPVPLDHRLTSTSSADPKRPPQT